MAIQFVRTGGAYNHTAYFGKTLTLSQIDAGDLVVVAIGSGADYMYPVASVTDSVGNTYVQAVHLDFYNSTHSASIWYCKNAIGSGGSSVTITFTTSGGADGYFIRQAVEYSGAHLTNPIRATNTLGSSGTTLTVGSLTVEVGDLVAGFWGASFNYGASADTGWTEREFTGSGTLFIDKIATSTSESPSGTGAPTSPWAAVAVAIIPAAAAPTPPTLNRGRFFPFFDDDDLNRFEFWPLITTTVFADTAARFIQQAKNFRDIAARLLLFIRAFIDTSARFKQVVRGYSDALNLSANITFLEAGGASTGWMHLWDRVDTPQASGRTTLDTTIKPPGAYSSIRNGNGTDSTGWDAFNVFPAASGRVSFYFRTSSWVEAPASSVLLAVIGDNFNYVDAGQLRFTNQGKLVWQAGNHITETSGNTVLAVDTWYRISFAFKANATNNLDAKVYINGVEDISVTGYNTGGTTPSQVISVGFGQNRTETRISWFAHFYVDDGADLKDTGNVFCTAKFPTSAFDDGFNSSGGTGAVNERPLSETNYKAQISAFDQLETYHVETASAGDVDISAARILGYMGWVWAKRAGSGAQPTQFVNGIEYPVVLTTSPAVHRQAVTNSTYPSANRALGMHGAESNPAYDVYLYELGAVVAYKEDRVLGRFTLRVQRLVDTYTRFVQQAQSFADTLTRFTIATGTVAFNDIVARFAQISSVFVDTAARLKVALIFPSTGLLDNFNRADENPASGWTNVFPAQANIKVVSNEARTGADSASYGVFSSFTPNNDQEAFLEIASGTAVGGRFGNLVGTFLRVSNENTADVTGYLAYASATFAVLNRYDSAAVSSQLAQFNLGDTALTAGDQLGARIRGSLIEIWVNRQHTSWNLVGTYTDTTYTSGKIGLAIYSIDDSISLDNFSGGTAGLAYRNIAARVLVFIRQYADVFTRFRLLGQSLRDISTRYIQQISGFRDIVARFRQIGLSYLDITTRFTLQLQFATLKDISARFVQQVRSLRDVLTRFTLQVSAFKDITTRFAQRVQAFRDISTRYILRVQALRDISARFVEQVRAFKDVPTRFIVRVRAFTDVPTRFIQRVQRYLDINTRFVTTVRAFKETAARFRQYVQNYRDTNVRYISTVRAFKDTSTRFVSGILVLRDVTTRFVQIARNYVDTGARFATRFFTFRDLPTRFTLVAKSYTDTLTRFALSLLATSDIAARFRQTVQALRGVSTRFVEQVRGYSDVSTRFLQIVRGYTDTVARYIQQVRIYQDVSARFAQITRAYSDVSDRFVLIARGFADVSARFTALISNYKDISVRFALAGSSLKDALARFILEGLSTKLYFRSIVSSNAPTTGTKSAVLPGAAGTNNTGYENLSLLPYKGVTETNISLQSDSDNAHHDQYLARFTSPPLAASSATIIGSTWKIALATSEADVAANSYLMASVYLWRPETASVVTYIYDSHTALGPEWSPTEDGIVVTFSGQQAIGQEGDVIVTEIWRHTPGQD